MMVRRWQEHIQSYWQSAAVLLIGAVVFGGCGPSPDTVGSNSKAAATAKLKPDYSTPKSSFSTFLRGLAAKDLDVLCNCISKKAPKEFEAIRNKSIAPVDLDEVAELFAECTVGEVENGEEKNQSVLPVSLRSRDERITMILEDGIWRILDF